MVSIPTVDDFDYLALSVLLCVVVAMYFWHFGPRQSPNQESRCTGIPNSKGPVIVDPNLVGLQFTTVYLDIPGAYHLLSSCTYKSGMDTGSLSRVVATIIGHGKVTK